MPNPDRQEPQPPELMSPWRTDARVKLQMDARAFARDVVLPIADELDKEKAEMPRSPDRGDEQEGLVWDHYTG